MLNQEQSLIGFHTSVSEHLPPPDEVEEEFLPIPEFVIEDLNDYLEIDRDARTTGEIEIEDIVTMMQSTESTSALNDVMNADYGDDEKEPQRPPTSSVVLPMLE